MFTSHCSYLDVARNAPPIWLPNLLPSLGLSILSRRTPPIVYESMTLASPVFGLSNFPGDLTDLPLAVSQILERPFCCQTELVYLLRSALILPFRTLLSSPPLRWVW